MHGLPNSGEASGTKFTKDALRCMVSEMKQKKYAIRFPVAGGAAYMTSCSDTSLFTTDARLLTARLFSIEGNVPRERKVKFSNGEREDAGSSAEFLTSIFVAYPGLISGLAMLEIYHSGAIFGLLVEPDGGDERYTLVTARCQGTVEPGGGERITGLDNFEESSRNIVHDYVNRNKEGVLVQFKKGGKILWICGEAITKLLAWRKRYEPGVVPFSVTEEGCGEEQSFVKLVRRGLTRDVLSHMCKEPSSTAPSSHRPLCITARFLRQTLVNCDLM